MHPGRVSIEIETQFQAPVSTYINLSLSVRMDSILARAKSLYLLGSYTNLFLIYSFLLVESAKLLLFQMSSS